MPQRPALKLGNEVYGGRALGPTSYHPKNKLVNWNNDTDRMSASFASKTVLGNDPPPITSDIDYMDDPYGSLLASIASSPSARGHGWPNALEPREPARDPGLDEFSISRAGTLEHEVVRTSRKYASSFHSGMKRMPPTKHITPEELGPGVYNIASASISVRDPKRASYCFKSQTASAMFDGVASQPPDTIQPIQSAILMKHWTSSGSAFSTRERFPRERKKWKD